MRAMILALVVGAAACASAPGTDEGTRYDPYVITRAEIAETRFETASEIVQSLRARWLAPVAGTSLSAGQGVVRVYVDGRPSGGLGSIPRMIIGEIRFYPPAEAQARWGLSHHRGAIDVITRTDGGE